MPLRIEALGPGHRQLLVGFQNQHTSLVEYLKRYALRHATKDLLARTFLAIDDAAGEPRLAGYFSLATVSVERASVGGQPDLEASPGRLQPPGQGDVLDQRPGDGPEPADGLEPRPDLIADVPRQVRV